MTREADILAAKVGVLRVLALHGPMTLCTLRAWHIDCVSMASQGAAVDALLASGFIESRGEHDVDVRGVDRSRWDTMSAAEKDARCDAIESAVRIAHIVFKLHHAIATFRYSDAAKAGADVAVEAARGLTAAARADALKEKP